MFEKEAEEYYYKTYPVTLNIGEEERKNKVTDIFIKGAELGYNKDKEELEQKYSKQADDFENMKAGLESEIAKLKEENKQLRNNYEDYKTVSEEEIIRLKELLVELYDCIPASMADSCIETLQKVALVFKED